ncbi:MAG: cadherin-like domain-containing protein [Verrucomicrobiales bacterium]|nr:cadherin-like domain-containing protein [Verrucomicrobiales bacterium]
MKPTPLAILAATGLLTPAATLAQSTTLLLKESFAREVSVRVGGVATPESADTVSRAISVFIGAEPEPPFRHAASREVGVVVTTPEVPARISELRVTSIPTGETITLSWQGYNPWAEHDIERYDIYMASHAFTDVSGMAPYTSLPGETFEVTLTGLTPWEDHFFAVVPVDALQGFESTVIYAADYSSGREVASREFSVFIASGADSPYAEVASRETSLLITTPEAPTRISQLTVDASPTGETVTLDWGGYNEWAQQDLARYDVYLATQAFLDVSGMTPYTSVPGGVFAVTLENLEPWQDRFFAVVPVDALEGFDPAVEYASAYLIARQTLSRETSVFVGAAPGESLAQAVSREVSTLVPTPEVPAPVTGIDSGFTAVESSSAFGAIDLDWPDYNELGQVDVVRYRVYAGPSYYEDVSGMEPYALVVAGNLNWTIRGLHPLGVYYVAVVAEDALGQWNPAVRSVSAQASIGAVGEVQQLAVTCASDALLFSWHPPEGADPLANDWLTEYRVYLAGAAAPIVLDRSATHYLADALEPAKGYPFRITTVDKFGQESSGSSVLAATLLGQPANLVADPFNGLVRLTWEASKPEVLVDEYRVYSASHDFDSVAGMTPLIATQATSVEFAGLENGRLYFFAVTTVNQAGCEDSAVETAAVTPNPRADEFADLELAELDAPSLAYPGQTVGFGWRVRNVGLAQTSRDDRTMVSAWSDRIMLSPDAVLGDGNDVVVAEVLHAGVLTVGSHYDANASVALPRVAPGRYHVFIVADAGDAVCEYLDEGANSAAAAQVLTLRLAIAPADQTVDELDPLSLTVVPGMTGLPEGALTFGLVEAPDGMSLEAETGLLTWTPSEAQGPGDHAVRLSATDNREPALTQELGFNVVVREVNAAPEFAPVNDLVVNSTAPVEVPLHATDTDLPAQEIRFQLGPPSPETPAGATVDPVSGRFTWTPPPGTPDATYPFTVLVRDDQTPPGEDTATFRITLERTPPQVVAVTPQGHQVIPLSFFEVVFSEAVTADALADGDAILLGPGGPIPLGEVEQPAPDTLRFSFATQSATGAYRFRLEPAIRDLAGNPLDADGDGTGGEADEDALTVAVSLAIIDLTVSQVEGPAQADPGAAITVRWTVANDGVAAAAGTWRDTIQLSADAQVGNDLPLGTFSFDSTIAGGGSETRTAEVTIPGTVPAGELHLVVVTDSAGDIPESREDNNAGLAAGTLTVPLRLTIQPATAELREGRSLSATLARNGDRTAPLTVALSSSDLTEIIVPDSVVIPAGAGSVALPVQAAADGIVDGTREATVTAAAAGFDAVTARFTVTDAQVPQLALAPVDGVVTEGEALELTVTTPLPPAADLAVTLTTPWPNQLAVPASVIIPAGQSHAAFTVFAAEDTLIEGDKAYTVTAAAAGHLAGAVEVVVQDNDVPSVSLTLSKSTISEGDGPQATIGTLTRAPVTDRAVTVHLEVDAPGLLLLGSVNIPANEAAATFAIGPVDNDDVDGPRQVGITGLAVESGGDRILAVTETAIVTITDDDGPTLKLAFAQRLVREGEDPATTLTVTRNTDPTEPLVVQLVSGDPSELLVPAQVTIPGGEASVSVGVASVDDGVTDGNQTVLVTASADGFTEGSETIVVSDTDLPDLVVTKSEGPASADTDAYVSVTYRVENQGAQPAEPEWTTRVFLSTDPIPGDDVLIGNYAFTGNIPVGQYYEQSVSVRMPTKPGDYWVVTEVDIADQIAETLEDNNRRIAKQPVRVRPAYTALVETDVETTLAGTPIPLHGTARKVNGLPAPEGSLVNIHLHVRDTHRIISALVNARGEFATVWHPLPTEAGFYEIGAAHPGEADAPVQDGFVLVGMTIEPSTSSVRVVEGATAGGELRLVNLSTEALSGLSLTLVEAPPNLSIEAEIADANLPGLGELPVTFLVTANDASTLTGSIVFRVESTEGAWAEAVIEVLVEPLRPRLVVAPAPLTAGMLRGASRTVTFEVSNAGGLASGPLNVVLPTVDWMAVVTPNPLPSLEPGASAQVSLLLTPPPDLDLGPYEGSLFVGNQTTGVNVPFTFRAISEAVGDLLVTAVDELTYYAEGSPKVAGATVSVRDPVTGAEVAGGVTDVNGEFFTAGLPEGYYEIEVTAAKHTSYQATHLLAPGETNAIQTFLSYQTVTYSWTVEPIEVEDRYRVEIETTFETVVPLPVVTIEPAVIDLALITADVTQVDLKITNHGLIAANNTKVNVPTHPLWQFTPLIEEIGVLPAKSSLTIPLTIRKLRPVAALAERVAPADGGAGPCSIAAYVCWELVCGAETYTHCGTVYFPNARGGCGGGGGGVVLPPPGGGGGGGGSYVVHPPRSTPLECDPCAIELAGKILRCIWNFVNPFPDLSKCLSGLYDCYQSPNPLGCISAVLACLKAFFVEVPGVGNGIAIYCCAEDLSYACGGDGLGLPPLCGTDPGSGGLGSSETGHARAGVRLKSTGLAGSTVSWSAAGVGPVVEASRRARAVLDVFVVLFGEPEWLTAARDPGFQPWYEILADVVAGTSEEAERISELERAALVGDPFAARFSVAAVERLVERWNRTAEYYAVGVLTTTDVPSGQNEDFIALDVLEQSMSRAEQAEEESRAAGFASAFQELETRLRELQDALSEPAGGVCARVKLRIDQDAVISRDAFRAALEIENSQNADLTDVEVRVRVFDEAGRDVTDLFGIREPVLSGLTSVDGAGIVAGGTTGSASWTLIPTVDAAPDGPVLYSIGGEFGYTQEGTRVRVPLSPVTITVLPAPRLWMKYFHQRDVYSDDPFTDETEPSIPFNLAVMIENRGQGTARNLHITSAQPQIIENEKGLLIDFKLIGTEVAGQNLTPSLTANFGDIPPGETVVGRWLMTSTLQGLFTDYQATFEHIDGLGNPRLSLIEDLSIHELIRLVYAGGEFDDGKPDFFVNDVPDVLDLGDTLYLSNGEIREVTLVEEGAVVGTLSPESLSIVVTTPMPPGWAYLRIPDPAQGQFRLAGVVRSDGTSISTDWNVWTTDRTFLGLGKRPRPEHLLHLLDHDSTGSYTLYYERLPTADTTAPISAVDPLPAQAAESFPVTWQGADEIGGSGLAFFDVFVVEDGGEPALWLSRTLLQGALFTGEVGHDYAFFTRASDAAGNREAAPVQPDATTQVVLASTAPTLSALGDQATDEDTPLAVDFTLNDPDTPLDQVQFTFESSNLTLLPPTRLAVTGAGQDRQLRIHPAPDRFGDAVVTLIASDGVDSARRTFRVTVRPLNDPPVANPDTVERRAGRSYKVAVAALLENDRDPEFDTLGVVAVSGSSAHGATVRLSGGWIFYQPDPAMNETDTFTYTVADGKGGEATGEVTLLVAEEPTGESRNWLAPPEVKGGLVTLRFVGIPGRAYQVQRRTGLTEGSWGTIATVTADATGRFEFTDENPPAGTAFYRAAGATTP